MYQDLNKSAVSAKSCGTMESGNHSENGANPKSRKSRNIFTMNGLMFIGMIILLFITAGCDKDNKNDEPEEPVTTVEEDKANIRASFTRTKDLIENFKKGSFYSFTEKFVDYHEEHYEDVYYYYVGEGYGDYSYNRSTGEYEYTPETGEYALGSNDYYDGAISEFTEMLGEKLGDVIDYDEEENENRFNFARLAGKYTWNSGSERWDVTSHNAILLSFPSSESKTANDCEAAFTAYEDKRCDIEGDIIYLPTKANIYLKKDNETLFSTNLSASYSEYGIPAKVTVNVYAKPLNVDVAFTQESATKLKADVNIENETVAENNLIIGCEATLAGNGITKYSDLDDIKLNVLKLTLRQHELSIVGTVDFKTLDGKRLTAENINECINFDVFYKTQKVGTLKVVDLDEDRYLYIVYKDDTKENTSIYYDSFITDIETILKKQLK
jgi:hypothetical protein